MAAHSCWWHFSLRIDFPEFENLNSCWSTALLHQGVLLSARVYMHCEVPISKTFVSGWDLPGSGSYSFVYKDPPDHVCCCWLLFAVTWRSQCFLLCSLWKSWCGCWICMCKRRNGGIESWVSPVPPSLYTSKRLQPGSTLVFTMKCSPCEHRCNLVSRLLVGYLCIELIST